MVDYYIIWILYNNQLYYPILRTRATFALVHAFDLPLAPYVPLTTHLCITSHSASHSCVASHTGSHNRHSCMLCTTARFRPTIGTRATYALVLLPSNIFNKLLLIYILMMYN